MNDFVPNGYVPILVCADRLAERFQPKAYALLRVWQKEWERISKRVNAVRNYRAPPDLSGIGPSLSSPRSSWRGFPQTPPAPAPLTEEEAAIVQAYDRACMETAPARQSAGELLRQSLGQGKITAIFVHPVTGAYMEASADFWRSSAGALTLVLGTWQGAPLDQRYPDLHPQVLIAEGDATAIYPAAPPSNTDAEQAVRLPTPDEWFAARMELGGPPPKAKQIVKECRLACGCTSEVAQQAWMRVPPEKKRNSRDTDTALARLRSRGV